MIDLNLNGKRALVLGASRGIGRATALELAELGCEIIALARDENELIRLMAELPKSNYKHSYLCLDLLDFPRLEIEIKKNLEARGPIEILINNTGGPKPGPIVDALDEQFDTAFKMHLRANALLTRYLLPGMKAQHYGRIINIISSSVKSPIDNLGVSNTVRWSVAAWAKTLSYEVARYGITVNSILPGFIQTDRLTSLFKHQAEMQGNTIDAIEREAISQIPAGRIGLPSEIAQVIAFLATPAASYVNGTAIAVDGGRTKVI